MADIFKDIANKVDSINKSGNEIDSSTEPKRQYIGYVDGYNYEQKWDYLRSIYGITKSDKKTDLAKDQRITDIGVVTTDNDNDDTSTGNFRYELQGIEDPTYLTFELVFIDDNGLTKTPLFNTENINSFIAKYYTADSNIKSYYEQFINTFNKIFKKDSETDNLKLKDYYIVSIAGLDSFNNKFTKYEEDKITITLREDVTMLIQYMSEMYNNLLYSYNSKRYNIPDNLLRFDLRVVVKEYRIFKIYDGEKKKLVYDKSKVSKMEYTLYDCNFLFFNSKNFGAELSVENLTEPAKLQFDIIFKSVVKAIDPKLIAGSINNIISKPETKKDIKNKSFLNKLATNVVNSVKADAINLGKSTLISVVNEVKDRISKKFESFLPTLDRTNVYSDSITDMVAKAEGFVANKATGLVNKGLDAVLGKKTDDKRKMFDLNKDLGVTKKEKVGNIKKDNIGYDKDSINKGLEGRKVFEQEKQTINYFHNINSTNSIDEAIKKIVERVKSFNKKLKDELSVNNYKIDDLDQSTKIKIENIIKEEIKNKTDELNKNDYKIENVNSDTKFLNDQIVGKIFNKIKDHKVDDLDLSTIDKISSEIKSELKIKTNTLNNSLYKVDTINEKVEFINSLKRIKEKIQKDKTTINLLNGSKQTLDLVINSEKVLNTILSKLDQNLYDYIPTNITHNLDSLNYDAKNRNIIDLNDLKYNVSVRKIKNLDSLNYKIINSKVELNKLNYSIKEKTIQILKSLYTKSLSKIIKLNNLNYTKPSIEQVELNNLDYTTETNKVELNNLNYITKDEKVVLNNLNYTIEDKKVQLDSLNYDVNSKEIIYFENINKNSPTIVNREALKKLYNEVKINEKENLETISSNNVEQVKLSLNKIYNDINDKKNIDLGNINNKSVSKNDIDLSNINNDNE